MPPKKNDNKEESMYSHYFTVTNEYIQKYGKRTVVFYQCGGFLELYALQNKDTGDIETPMVEEFTSIANIVMTIKKKAEYNDRAILMAGFPEQSYEKFVKVAINNSITAVIFLQTKDPMGNIYREFHESFSPGSYISYDTDNTKQLSNNIMCIWLDKYISLRSKQPMFICGLATVHIFSGESSIFQYETPFHMNPTSFDELERYVSVIQPSEVIIVSSLDENQTNTIIKYSGLTCNSIHKIIIESESNVHKIQSIENCQKQNYIVHTLSSFFGEETYQICTEFRDHNFATQSFCYLLSFLQQHNPDIVKKIKIPIFNNTSSRMVLANHTLKQLNIIYDNSDEKNTYSSVLTLLNKCITPMGKRKFQHQLTNPTFNEQWLTTEYQMTEYILQKDNEYMIPLFRKQLYKIRDLDKILRQLVVKKLYPNSIFHLYESIIIIQQLHITLFENKELVRYLCENNENPDHIQLYFKKITDHIHKFLFIDRCSGIISSSFNENIIQPNISESLDEIVKEYEMNIHLFENVKNILNNIMKKHEQSEDIEYIKVHDTEKSGSTLQITKKRGEVLKKILSNSSTDKNGLQVIEFHTSLIVPIKDIRFIKANSLNDEIEFPQFTSILKKIMHLKEKLSSEIYKVYLDFLKTLEEDYYDILQKMNTFICGLDVIINKAYIATTYNYCKPTIDTTQEQSFFNVIGLRHALIEHIQQNEIYVTNDLILGKTEYYNGTLIFGTNAVGKTSFIRAIGIAIIMAQTGLYVPCSSFTYKPYTAIFSRILGNDNIFKGLSTFAVEMSELRIILKMADKNSLVLGDELCSGTEIESALSLFSAGLVELHKKNSTFLFATHFHEITKYEEIRRLEKMCLKHMAVHYDSSIKSLVYDRKLIDGQGSRIYGLEVCKSLYMDPDFLDLAYEFRNKYFPDTKGELSYSPSQYNISKIRGLCEICKCELAEEIHHLSPQKNADENGFIGSFHKNHKANLTSVCEKCQDTFHKHNIIKTKKKTVDGYKIL